MGYCYANRLAAHIARNCSRPMVAGYTGRALLIPADQWRRAKLVVDANNPQKVKSVVMPFASTTQVFVVENYGAQPFTGSTTAGSTEVGFQKFLKTLTLRVPLRGASAARDIVQPLAKDGSGYVAIVEKKDRIGDGSFEIVGLQVPLVCDASTITRDESAGGAWSVSLTCTEGWAEATLVGSEDTYDSARAEFLALLAPPTYEVLTFTGNAAAYTLNALTTTGDTYLTYTYGGKDVVEYLGASVSGSRKIELPAAGVSVSVFASSIKIFYCYSQKVLTSLDVSGATALTGLQCGDNPLTALDVSKNTALIDLRCYSNQLTALDVSKNTALTGLSCGSNQLTALDVSKNTALTGLSCGSNPLTALDVSKNTALIDLRCYSNQLTALDVSKNTALTLLQCHGNKLTALDVSKNTALTSLWCNQNPLTALDVSNCTKLTRLDGAQKALATIGAANTSATAYTYFNTALTNGNVAAAGTLTTDGTDASVTLRTTAEAKGWTVNVIS